MKRRAWSIWVLGILMGTATGLAGVGCWGPPSAHTVSRDYSLGDAPIDPPRHGPDGQFDDDVAGGKLFQMYCGTCHNARPLGERPFSNYEVAMAHMREQAYLTGKEYRQLIHFLRRWQDVGPPTPEVEPTPKRFYFSQPIPELRPRREPEAAQGSGARAPGP